MVQVIDTSRPEPHQTHAAWGWLWLLLLGVGLFVLMTIVMFATGNPNLYPTVILIGNSLVPIGVWTAILSAVLFRQSGPKHFRLTGAVLVTFLFVALLHGLWDGLPPISYLALPFGIHLPAVQVVLSVIGLTVLRGLWCQAQRQQAQEPAMPTARQDGSITPM